MEAPSVAQVMVTAPDEDMLITGVAHNRVLNSCSAVPELFPPRTAIALTVTGRVRPSMLKGLVYAIPLLADGVLPSVV